MRLCSEDALWFDSKNALLAVVSVLLVPTISLKIEMHLIWASSRENLTSGFPIKPDSNRSPQLQRQARKLKFRS